MSNKNPKSTTQVNARNHRQQWVSQTDVNYMALSVNHDVSVVSILDLEDVTSDGVRSHRLNEVQPGLLEGDRVLSTIFAYEEIEQVVDFGPSHLVS